MERKLYTNDVSYKIKDETKEGKNQPYRPNQERIILDTLLLSIPHVHPN
jgi:hypothetical protein